MHKHLAIHAAPWSWADVRTGELAFSNVSKALVTFFLFVHHARNLARSRKRRKKYGGSGKLLRMQRKLMGKNG